MIGVAAVRAQVIDDLAPADLAQPREDRRFAAEKGQLAHGFAEGGLHDLTSGLHIAAEPRQSKPVQTGKMSVEERIECSLIPGEHASDELGFVGQCAIHDRGLLDWDGTDRINQSLEATPSQASVIAPCE